MRAPRPSLVDDDVAGGDGRARVRGRGHHGRAHRALHAAALVLDEERPEVELDLRVGVRRSATEECRGLLHPHVPSLAHRRRAEHQGDGERDAPAGGRRSTVWQ
jgi:hypothetical protein